MSFYFLCKKIQKKEKCATWLTILSKVIAPRLIIALTLLEGKVVKTKKFEMPRYVGDPLNAVTIFSKFEADELIILDISESHGLKPTNSLTLARIPNHASMPIGFGGGLKSMDGVIKAIESGYDKVVIRSEFQNFSLLADISNRYGAQALAICLDVKENRSSNALYTINDQTFTPGEASSLMKSLEESGVGEIIVHDVESDGIRGGLRKMETLDLVLDQSSVPVVALGGCSSIEDAAKFLGSTKNLHSVAAASIFVLKEPRDAVLLHYPRHKDWLAAINRYN